MKSGSLVVLVTPYPEEDHKIAASLGAKLPQLNVIEEVDCIVTERGSDVLYLVGYEWTHPTPQMLPPGFNARLGFDPKMFREVQPPMDISELVEETKVLEVEGSFSI